MIITQPIELTAYTTWLCNDSIVRTRVKSNASVTCADDKVNSIDGKSLCNGIYLPLFVYTRNIQSITKGARDYFSMNNRGSQIVAFAIVIDSPLSRIVGNFFMGLNKPR